MNDWSATIIRYQFRNWESNAVSIFKVILINLYLLSLIKTPETLVHLVRLSISIQAIYPFRLLVYPPIHLSIYSFIHPSICQIVRHLFTNIFLYSSIKFQLEYFNNYCHNIEHTATWGGEIEVRLIQVVANANVYFSW